MACLGNIDCWNQVVLGDLFGDFIGVDIWEVYSCHWQPKTAKLYRLYIWAKNLVSWKMTNIRDCQTFSESKSSWGSEIQGLPHLSSYGIFRPDPCRFGICLMTPSTTTNKVASTTKIAWPKIEVVFFSVFNNQAGRWTWGEGGGGEHPGDDEVGHLKVTVRYVRTYIVILYSI